MVFLFQTFVTVVEIVEAFQRKRKREMISKIPEIFRVQIDHVSPMRTVQFLHPLCVASDPDAGARISQLQPDRKYLAGVGVTLAAARSLAPHQQPLTPAGCSLRPLQP